MNFLGEIHRISLETIFCTLVEIRPHSPDDCEHVLSNELEGRKTELNEKGILILCYKIRSSFELVFSLAMIAEFSISFHVSHFTRLLHYL